MLNSWLVIEKQSIAGHRSTPEIPGFRRWRQKDPVEIILVGVGLGMCVTLFSNKEGI